MKLNNNNDQFFFDNASAINSANNNVIPAGTYVVSLRKATLYVNEGRESFMLNLKIEQGRWTNRFLNVFLNVQPDVVVKDGKIVFEDGKAVVKTDEQGNPTYDNVTRKLNVLVGCVVDPARIHRELDSTNAFEEVLRAHNGSQFSVTVMAVKRDGYITPNYFLRFIKPVLSKEVAETVVEPEISADEVQDTDL